MVLPIIASQISFAVGLVMVLSVIWRGFRHFVAEEGPENAEIQEGLADFIKVQRKKIQIASAGYWVVLRYWYLSAAQRVLHLVRILALKLENVSARWLHQVRKINTLPVQPIQPMQSNQPSPQKAEEGNSEAINRDFFSALKQSSNHQVVETKLEELKSNKTE